jgi:hypothetical protein
VSGFRAEAINGVAHVGATIRIGQTVDDNLLDLGGAAYGAQGISYGGYISNTKTPGIPGFAWNCKPNPPGAFTNKNVRGAVQFDVHEGTNRHRSDESTADKFGDRVLASGRITGETRWATEPSPSPEVTIGRTTWAWEWVLICQNTAKGSC